MKRAILYARVSTEDQGDNYSPRSQIELCRQYAAQIEYEIVAEFLDEFSGATAIEQRPEGRKVYAMLKNNEADALIALSIDRLVRPPEEGDEWDMPVLIRGLAKLDKEIHTANKGKLGTSFADLLIALLDAKKAGDERRDIRERMMRGKRFKAQDNKVTGGGVAPYGYRVVRDEKGRPLEFEIFEPEANIVRMMFDWYVNYHYSIMRIIRELGERHILTPGERKGNFHRKRASGIWSAGVIHRLLSSEIYAGVWVWNRRNSITGRFRDTKEHIRIDVPAIVSRELWEMAKAQRGYNRISSSRNSKREYVMRGLLKCACGCAFVGHFQNNRKYYNCARRSNIEPHVEKNPCRARAVRAEAIETAVWESTRDFFKNIPELKRLLREAQDKEAEKQEPLREELVIVREFLKECDQDASDCARSLKRAKGRVAEKLLADQETINARYANLQKRLGMIEAKLKERIYTDEAINNTLQFAEDVALGMDDPDIGTMRHQFDRLAVEITINSTPGAKPYYHLKCILGEWDGDLPMPQLNWQMKEERLSIVSPSSKP